MADTKGRFLWYELLTTDIPAARKFYSNVVGWQATEAPMPGSSDATYTMLSIDSVPVGGMMDLPQQARDMGAPPNWMGYVSVDDVDASARAATAGGGHVFVEPMDIPGVGRFAVVADPTGAVTSLFKSANPDQDQPQDQIAKGRVGWHELYAGDLNPAWDFYSKLYGWEKKDSMDMGDMGVYLIFGVGDAQLGGMMTKPPQVPVPYWSYYFNVGNIDEAAGRVKSSGGQVLNGPMEVPGGGWIVQCLDPQGAAFALFGSR